MSEKYSSWSSDVGGAWQIQFFRAVIRIGGVRLAYQMMYVVVLWYLVFVPEVRRRIRPYLRRRFGRGGGMGGFWDGYRLVCSFGQVLIDQAAVALIGPHILDSRCPDASAVRGAIEGNGAIVLMSHTGCWQLAMPALAGMERPISAVMLPQGPDAPVAKKITEWGDMNVVDPRSGMDSMVEMMQALGKGHLLTIMGDRVFGPSDNSVKVPFLGEKIDLPATPYRLARAAGVPVLVLYAVKVGYLRYEVQLGDIIRVETDSRRPEKAGAKQYVRTLEEFVRRNPFQFYNFFDLWGAQKSG